MSAVLAVPGPATRSLIAASLAGLAYGGWAYFINSSVSEMAGWKAACIQGGYSFLLTTGMTLLMDYFLRVFRNSSQTVVFTIITISALCFSVAYGAHWIADTPEILATILPGFCIGVGYTTAYVIAFNRQGPLENASS